MRRVARHLSRLGAALALLLSLAVCVLWVRSRSGSDTAMWTHYRWAADGSGGAEGDWVHLVSDNGRLSFARGSARAGPPRAELAVGIHLNAREYGGRPRLQLVHQSHAGLDGWLIDDDVLMQGTSGWGPLRWQRHSSVNPGIPLAQNSVTVYVSHWLAAGLLAAPVVWVAGQRHARRRRDRLRAELGLCLSCGYNLRGSPGRCPECGAAPPVA